MVSSIQHLSREEINDDTWDETILRSINSNIYATTTWLDNMSPNWGALIIGNYDTVMPLTFKKKWGVRYLAQPAFTQSLGIFSAVSLPPDVVVTMIENAKKISAYAAININVEIDHPLLIKRKNYCLNIADNYQTVSASYHNVLLKNLKRSTKNMLRYKTGKDIQLPVILFEALYAHNLRLKKQYYNRIMQLATNPPKHATSFTREIRDNNNDILSASLFFKYRNRIYNIISATSSKGKKMEATRYLYDNLIREFCGSNYVLDFEGGNTPGIEQFYQQFGALPEYYYALTWNNLKWPLKLLKK